MSADELRRHKRAPFPTGPDVLVVVYYGSAEMGCFLALNWPMPANLLDLYVEFSNITNGKSLPSGRGLLGRLVYHGLSGVSYAEKQTMRNLAIRGGPYTPDEMTQFLEYCESDVRRPPGPAAGHGAVRDPLRPAARPLHPGGSEDGSDRHPDRRRDAHQAVGQLGAYQGETDRDGG